MTLLKHLFSPLRINRLEIPNRAMMSGMHLGMEDVDDIYGRMAAFFSLRARGEAGLIIVGGCSPNTAGKGRLRGNFSIEDNDQIPLHQKITTGVHEYDPKIALQICHFGRESFHGRSVSASGIRAEGILYRPKEMTAQEIEKTVNDFAAAALRAVESGYDAIEIVGSQGFLLHQFLSRATNRRTDEWGGSFENRLRFTLAVLRSVRNKIGPDFPLIYRMPALDLVENGNRPEEVLMLHQEVSKIGVDLINVGIGWHDSKVPTVEMSVPRAAFSIVAKYIKSKANGTPVAVSNRINNPMLAEELLINRVADVIAMGRPFLADSDLMRKARQNHFDTINTCVACNQGCLDHALTGKRVCCMVNPDCASEDENKISQTSSSKKIAVIGGGIAGMRSALTLSMRGHQVILYEKQNNLGGQLLLASSVPGKEEFSQTIRYYTNAVVAAGVDIRLNTEPDENLLLSQQFDHIVLAAGYAPKKRIIPGEEHDHVFTYEDILKYRMPVPEPVVIIGGGAIALNIAYYLHKKNNTALLDSQMYLERFIPASLLEAYKKEMPSGSRIILLNRSGKNIGRSIGPTTRWVMIQKIAHSGIKVVNRINIKKIKKEYVVVEHQDKKSEPIIAKTVVLAIGQDLNNALENKIKRLKIPYSVIGPVMVKNKLKYNAMVAIQEANAIAKDI